mgnify:CR=1 FL=1
MAVLASKRSESNLLFLENARNLEIYTLKRTVRFPKRYQALIGDMLVKLSASILNDLKAANSIYPVNAHEVQMRRDYMTHAQASAQQMLSQIDVARVMFQEMEDYQPKESVWLIWMRLLDDEARLISGAKKSDRDKFKDLG